MKMYQKLFILLPFMTPLIAIDETAKSTDSSLDIPVGICLSIERLNNPSYLKDVVGIPFIISCFLSSIHQPKYLFDTAVYNIGQKILSLAPALTGIANRKYIDTNNTNIAGGFSLGALLIALISSNIGEQFGAKIHSYIASGSKS